MTEEQKITPELRIINATIDCIEQYGLQGATNRRIAEKADVNVAAINYYFRSKQNLMDQVMNLTLDNAFDWEDLFILPDDTPQQWCVEILVDLTKGALNYRGLTRAHFSGMMLDGDYNSLGARRMTAFIQQWAAELQQRGIKMPEKDLYQALAQLGYAFISAIMAPKLFEQSFGISLTTEEVMREFYGDMVEKVLG